MTIEFHLLFPLLKGIHLTTVSITIIGFILRGVWMLKGSPRLEMRLTRTLPHVNDTVLLFSAIATGAVIDAYPFVSPWLTAKVFGLLGYILLGAVALTYGPNKLVRTIAFAGAMLCFIYVISVALTKNPLPFS